MDRILVEKHPFLIAAISLSLAGCLCAGAYGQSKPKVTKAKAAPAAKKAADSAESAEPDKVLYENATTAIKHGKYTEARLDFQTLINTYPDSEYLAKAKLGIADSFYKEGGTSNLTQAVEEYKNFIVFFPFLDEASYAQMQVAMAHYRMMEKADRDTSQAEQAEDEFREFLLKYPQSPLVPKAEQYLRDVQEVIADGEFRIARFYYTRPDYRAAEDRLVEVTARYPLYSQSDEALWMLGDVYARAKQTSKNEDQKNRWADLAGQCYDRIIQDYPLSTLVPGAKERLKAMGMPIPAPKPDALARMQKQERYERDHRQMALKKVPMEMVKSSPDVFYAARSGNPNLTPPDDTVSPMGALNQSAGDSSFTVAAVGASTAGGTKAAVDTESVDTSTTAPDASSAASGSAAAVQILDAPAAGAIANSAPADPPAAVAVDSALPNAAADPAPAANAPVSTSSQTESSTTQAADASTAQPAAQAATDKSDPTTESTSKKKKGLHKLVPF